MKQYHRPHFCAVFKGWQIAGWLLLATFQPLLAADTNFLEALRAANRTTPAVWGGANPGTVTTSASDPRAAALAAQLRQTLGQSGVRQAATVTNANPSGSTEAQQAALQQLIARAGGPLKVHLRPGNQTVMQIGGGILEYAGVSIAAIGTMSPAESVARRFLRSNGALLRLDDPDQELSLDSQQLDDLGRRHFRFSQKYQGLPVWPDGLSVHLDPQGNVDLVDGAYVPTPSSTSIQPGLNADEGTQRARGSLAGGEQAIVKNRELIIFAPLLQVPRLAWKITVSVDLLNAWVVVVDATDGRVLDRITLSLDANVPTSAPDLAGVTRNINVWSANGNFFMADTTKQSYNPAFDPIADPHGVITIFDARLVTQAQLQTVFIVQTNSATTWLPDAVGAAFNFGLTYDYYLARHNRNSLDGQGGSIRAAVRVKDMDNAFWSGDSKMMFFGNVRPYPNALDVVGHELTHGVTQNSADLIYELQPGALNESFSDIFGEMVEARAVGTTDWKIGTQLGSTFRDFKNPGTIHYGNQPYPSKMSEYINLPNDNNNDHGGVHVNSSIQNHAFYLLAEGLTGAIGLQDAEKIFYRNLTQHLQKQSQFADARLGSIASAEEIFGAGSGQALKTAEAFDAVEIFATPATPPPPPLPPVQGTDSTLLIGYDTSSFPFKTALGRRETALNDPADGAVLVEPVKAARPSVAGNGTFAVFVSSANDMGIVDTANPNSLQFLGLPGQVHSVAMSPDGNQYAFVLRDAFFGLPDNQITVVDLVNSTTHTFTLLSPVMDGAAVDTVVYADSMVFTSDGSALIYDAVSQIRFGTAAPVQRWSIFRINLATGTTTVLVPPLEGFDTGNPNLGRAGNRYLTFDVTDLDTDDGYIVNLDLFTGDGGFVGDVGQGLGYPTFSGDESAVIYAARSALAFTGYSLVRQPLAANRLTNSGPATLWLDDASIGVIYRRGNFTVSNSLPAVTLTNPVNNVIITPGSNITLGANATDSDGIAKVEFYEGARKLGESTAQPYQFTWTNVTAGNYRLSARAIDFLGGTSDSAVVNITVGTIIRLSATPQPGNTIRLTLTAPSGSYTVEDSTTLTNWNTAFPLTIDASGTGTVNDTRTPSPAGQLFYRAKKN